MPMLLVSPHSSDESSKDVNVQRLSHFSRNQIQLFVWSSCLPAFVLKILQSYEMAQLLFFSHTWSMLSLWRCAGAFSVLLLILTMRKRRGRQCSVPQNSNRHIGNCNFWLRHTVCMPRIASLGITSDPEKSLFVTGLWFCLLSTGSYYILNIEKITCSLIAFRAYQSGRNSS